MKSANGRGNSSEHTTDLLGLNTSFLCSIGTLCSIDNQIALDSLPASKILFIIYLANF